MFWTFDGLLLALLCLGVNGSQSLYDLQWLSCRFVDEKVHINKEDHIETEYITRAAVLQFGKVGDRSSHPTITTFLVTASKVDMRRYLEGAEDKLQCEIHRYSTGRIKTRWPTAGAQDHDVWFTSTIRHSEGLFVTKTFLRHTTVAPVAPDEEQMDFLQWETINDGDLLTMSAAMVFLSKTPSVDVGLFKEPDLDCRFAVDHALPHATVEWKLQQHGRRTDLFSYSSRTGKTEGNGVALKAIAAGNVSYKLRSTSTHSEGTYICSVMVPPLNGSHDIPLRISEQPHVSINVGSTLSMKLGEVQMLKCDAERYYPLDVDIKWYRETPDGSPTPPLKVRHSSHERHRDGTHSVSAFFYLKPSMEESGYKYTCSVSHKSLLSPIYKSFTLRVTDPDSTLWYIAKIGFIISMVVIICYMRPQYLGTKSGKKVRMKVGIEE
ncbi:hypothetical protein QQF64_032676 [Cirrhinus molitorella]|uniref:Ig-like domain-containing protein n=1 Tax=Cirrhinus molitorella TaxID=172907 RepID=A0ABR3MRR3_9TELE